MNSENILSADIQQILRRIDALVELRGMSKEDFYRKSGISSASFSQWNTGKYRPSTKKLITAANVLDVSVHYLMTGQPDKNETAPGVGDGLEEEIREIIQLLNEASPELRAAALAVLKSAGGSK